MSEGYVGAYSGKQAVGDFCTVSPTIHGNPSVASRVGSHCFDSGTCVPVAAVTAKYL